MARPDPLDAGSVKSRRVVDQRVPLTTIARQWGHIGVVGFGGPPAHISLLRRLCVDERGWITPTEFEDGIAATNLLPGPASTQLAIFCAWRLRGVRGALVGGACFILPGLAIIIGLSALFLRAHPPRWVEGIAAGMGAAVPVVALHAASGLVPSSWKRTGPSRANRLRWVIYLLIGFAAAATVGPYLVLVLLVCGLAEVFAERGSKRGPAGGRLGFFSPVFLVGSVATAGGLAALSWVAFKVGALSYGGGFVIVPLMQHDAVNTYHWMSGSQFLDAVALGQVTPGPVVLTVAVVGYAAGGVGGALLATLIAFGPSFLFVLSGGPHFDRLRSNDGIQSFLTGAGAGAIGAIAGSSIPLGAELVHLWQVGVLVLAAVWLLVFRKGVLPALAGAAALGLVAALAGASIVH
jgi:chromate transporter